MNDKVDIEVLKMKYFINQRLDNNASKEDIERTILALEANKRYVIRYRLLTQIFQFIKQLIMLFIFAIILALFIRGF